MEYVINRAKTAPRLDGDWNGKPWQPAHTGNVSFFHQRSSDHHPVTHFRALHDDDGLYLIYRVQDHYVRSVHTEFQSSVCTDSCVEAFLEPKAGKGYFNFEVNCGGALLCYYIEDPTRRKGRKGFGKWSIIPDDELRTVQIFHSMPDVVKTEIKAPTEWIVEYFVPTAFFERYVGELETPADRRWRGNFYKCGDRTSKPHWGSWSPIGPKLDFHQPDFFAPIRFEAKPTVKIRRRVAGRRSASAALSLG